MSDVLDPIVVFCLKVDEATVRRRRDELKPTRESCNEWEIGQFGGGIASARSSSDCANSMRGSRY